MSLEPSETWPTRRRLLQAGASLGALSLAPSFGSASTSVLPFRVNVPQAALDDLTQRLRQTRWPAVETVADRAQGVQLARLKALVHRWSHGYDWRRAEARLNALPQYVTRIDGVDIHFIHVRSRHGNALPLVMTHGWPGSVFELLDTIGPLTDPTSHGGHEEDAFHLVLPSLPGFGFSGSPTQPGWGPERVARAWHELMQRLGYRRYVSQGGDWGAIVTDALGRQAPEGLIGIHVNRVERSATLPPEVAFALKTGAPAPQSLDAQERHVFDETREFLARGLGYASIMATRPQTLAFALSDSPVGLAAWIYDKFADWVETRGDPERSLGVDAMLDDITLYWLTNTGASASRIYWENAISAPATTPISVPAAVTVFPGEVYRPPEAWARRAYKKLTYYNMATRGGHFAAWEQPQLFSEELRAAFRSMR